MNKSMISYFIGGFVVGCLVGGLSISLGSTLLDRNLAYQDELGTIDVDFGQRVLLTSLSPNDSARVVLVDLGTKGENFEVRLQQKQKNGSIAIFTSPDEPILAGAQKVIWKRDSSQFLLIGRHFYVEDPKLPSGEIAYLLYNIRTQKLYCPQRLLGLPEYNCEALTADKVNQFVKDAGFY